MTVLEIEDYYGNTIGAILVIPNAFAKGGIDIIKFKNLEISDKDGDYIFNTEDELIRLQVTEK